ncbi:transcriptional regulator with XRE-family HTH domain [Azospirillum agricola]|uniref:helix-turn-helix domain-containing protein n=1 Tax=Azospirillum agricola TaxID=1720247 RepID=UPI00398A8F85|nr:transcriptional regulator with XRE-family HTH domain [Azospirillum agricola]
MDAHVGQRVRMRRTLLGMSQEKLGEAIGLTFQQVQKYERGSNRISAGTLYRLGQVLDVPVSFFFDCYGDPNAPAQGARADDASATAGSQISRREARLLRLWRAAPPHVSDELLSLLSSLSPALHETLDGSADGSDEQPDDEMDGHWNGEEPASESNGQAVGGQAIGESAPRVVPRQSRGETMPRVKPLKDGGGGSKPRRRHGAVWDPTDIARATKTPSREG